jgi:ATP-dependent Clp protease adaptor protein ClpS
MEGKQFIKPNKSNDYKSVSQCVHNLILYNDDINLYEFVVDTLVEVCKLDVIQAEQCTLIAHHKGKCDVKSGSFDSLKPIKDQLLQRGLSATIIVSS